jgi:transcriptional regulator with XRE-family HTH domain
MVTQLILAEMDTKGVNQTQLAEGIGMNRSQLSRMLRDPDHNYTVRTLRRIASALGTTLTIAFDDEGAA